MKDDTTTQICREYSQTTNKTADTAATGDRKTPTTQRTTQTTSSPTKSA